MCDAGDNFSPRGDESLAEGMEGLEFFIEKVGASLVPEQRSGCVAATVCLHAESSVVGKSEGADVMIGDGESGQEKEGLQYPPDDEASANAMNKHGDLEGEEAGDDVVSTVAGGGWTRRVRVGKAPPARERNPARQSALETSIRDFAERKTGSVINPTVGITFDSLGEAYDFYNLYSWEKGFGIRYAKSRLNVHRVKCMQEIVCGCAAKPLAENSRSTRCGCKARVRLLRTGDNGWFCHRQA